MSETVSEQEEELARQQSLYNSMELVLKKLQCDGSSITRTDAQSLADVVQEGDTQTAAVIGALADLALQNESKGVPSPRDECPPTSYMSQLVDDLHSTVTASPEDVTQETLETTRRILDSGSHSH